MGDRGGYYGGGYNRGGGNYGGGNYGGGGYYRGGGKGGGHHGSGGDLVTATGTESELAAQFRRKLEVWMFGPSLLTEKTLKLDM